MTQVHPEESLPPREREREHEVVFDHDAERDKYITVSSVTDADRLGDGATDDEGSDDDGSDDESDEDEEDEDDSDDSDADGGESSDDEVEVAPKVGLTFSDPQLPSPLAHYHHPLCITLPPCLFKSGAYVAKCV